MTVTVYAKPGCPPCDATIRTLEKMGLAYVKLDVTEDTAAYEACQVYGYLNTPVVVVSYEVEDRCGGSDQDWSGFRPDRLAALAVT